MNDINKEQYKNVRKYLESSFVDTECLLRDREQEKYLIQKSKVELKLLMNLEAQVFDEWSNHLYNDEQSNYLSIRYKPANSGVWERDHNHDTKLIFKTDYSSIPPSNNREKVYLGSQHIYFSLDPNSECQVLSHVVERNGKLHQECHFLDIEGHDLKIDREFIYTPLIYLHFEVNCHSSEKYTVELLANRLEISDDVFCTKNWLDGRTGWKQYMDMLLLGEHDIKQLSDSDDYFICFHNKQGFITCVINRNCNNKTLLPITAWTKGGVEQRYYLNIPPSKPYPLFNLPDIYNKPDAIIFLTDALEIAVDNGFALESKGITGKIWTSWYGSQDAIADVDWSCLRKRTVYYFITEYSDISLNEAYETAYAVYNKLRQEFKKIDLHFIEYKPAVVPENKPQLRFLIMTDEEFEKKAKVVLGIEEEKDDPVFLPQTMQQIISEKLPERAFLLDPILLERSATLMYAKTNVGKTWLALSMGIIIASGGIMFQRWKAKTPRKVLYIDSEMDEKSLQNRIRIISKMNFDGKKYCNGSFRNNFFCISKKRSSKINAEFQEHVIAFVKRKGISLVVLDNLTAFTQHNDSARSWEDIHIWLDKLKISNCSVLLVHHTNKAGEQRGTSATTNAVDNVIHIKKENEIVDDSSAFGMSIHIEKGRDIYGLAKETFKVVFSPNDNPPSSVLFPDDNVSEKKEVALKHNVLHFKDNKNAKGKKHKSPDEKKAVERKVFELLNEGKAIREIACMLNISAPAIYQINGLTSSDAYKNMRKKRCRSKADRNEQVLALLTERVPVPDLAHKLGISITTVNRIQNKMFWDKIEPLYRQKKKLPIAEIAAQTEIPEDVVEKLVAKRKIAEIPTLYKAGKSFDEIRKRLALPLELIEKTLAGIEVKKERALGRNAELEKLKDFYEKGFPEEEIIKQVNLPLRTIKVELGRLRRK